jgi:cytochrome c
VRISSVSAAVIGLMVITGSAALAQAKPVAKPTGDAVAGKVAFTTRCQICHVAGGVGGPLAPDLRGVYGRTSGAGAFARYSAAMKGAKIIWSEPTIDTFLQGPAKLVPGTIMVIAPPPPPDRKNIIAYLATLKK